MSGIVIEQPALGIPFEQGLMGMLAMNINELFPEVAQLGQRHGTAIDVGAGAAIG